MAVILPKDLTKCYQILFMQNMWERCAQLRFKTYLRHDGYSCSRSVYTSLRFCLRNTLNPMNTRFIFQFAVDTISFYLHHICFESSFLSLKNTRQFCQSYKDQQEAYSCHGWNISKALMIEMNLMKNFQESHVAFHTKKQVQYQLATHDWTKLSG